MLEEVKENANGLQKQQIPDFLRALKKVFQL